MARPRIRVVTTVAERPGEDEDGARCAPEYHEAVELIGRRWTGAIVAVLLASGPLRFRQIAQAVPDLSDRLLAQRMKELEARGMVERRVLTGRPTGVEYALTPMGEDLQGTVRELTAWARRWLL